MKMFSLKLPRLRGNGVDGVAPRSQVSSESRVSIACRDTVAAWSELVSRTSEAELSAEGDIEVARLRFELALSVARKEPCADSSDACLKILLVQGTGGMGGRRGSARAIFPAPAFPGDLGAAFEHPSRVQGRLQPRPGLHIPR